MNSGIFKLNIRDVVKGLVVAVLTPVFAALLHAMSVPGFDFMVYDWQSLGMLGLSAGAAYLLKNLFSDDQGKVFGAI